MMIGDKATLHSLLRSTKNILLVDWPDEGVPRVLLNAGFTVYCYSPDGYTQANIVDHLENRQQGLSPRDKEEKGYLIFKQIPSRPETIDIVNVFRPDEELPGIITNIVLPCGAKVLWLHPPVSSVKAKEIAGESNIAFIEGSNIAEIALEILK